jgi:hypothetical protein
MTRAIADSVAGDRCFCGPGCRLPGARSWLPWRQPRNLHQFLNQLQQDSCGFRVGGCAGGSRDFMREFQKVDSIGHGSPSDQELRFPIRRLGPRALRGINRTALGPIREAGLAIDLDQ